MNSFDFEKFPTLETERLKLRRITADDTQAWLAVWSDPDVMRYLIEFENIPDEAEVKSIIEWTEGIYSRKTGIRWAITHKPDDKMIGSCGFHLYDKYNRCVEIGYELHQDYWRQGIMSEAISELLRFCFDTMNLHRVEANVTVGNDASAGLLYQFGFTQEGTWRDKVFWHGEFYSLWQFGLLEGEYQRFDKGG